MKLKKEKKEIKAWLIMKGVKIIYSNEDHRKTYARFRALRSFWGDKYKVIPCKITLCPKTKQ